MISSEKVRVILDNPNLQTNTLARFLGVDKATVRRVLCNEGWRWALVRECKNQEEWDYYFDEDKICLEDLNAELGLI